MPNSDEGLQIIGTEESEAADGVEIEEVIFFR
jgi:hypothetical protein